VTTGNACPRARTLKLVMLMASIEGAPVEATRKLMACVESSTKHSERHWSELIGKLAGLQ
jgi:hypothetical protein